MLTQGIGLAKPREDIPTGAITGTTGSDGNTSFSLPKTPIPGWTVAGWRNGARLFNGIDFTVNGTAIVALAPNIPMGAFEGNPADSYVFNYWTYDP